jgi:alpha/beta superfamily hydrolase
VRAGEREYRYRFLSNCAQPKLFISGAEDEFGPQAEVEAAVAQAMPPAELVMVPGANHFFSGKLEFMQEALSLWIESQIETRFCPAPPAATP